MFRSKNRLLVVSLLAALSMLLSACAAPTPTPAQVAPPTAIAVQPTKAVATQTPVPVKPTEVPTVAATVAPAQKGAKDPTTWNRQIPSGGDPTSLDPAHDYESLGTGILLNIYEGLYQYDGADPSKVKPLLADALVDPVDTPDGGSSYTYHLISGVKFQNGDDLTAEDVAFSFQRQLLLADPNDPALLHEAFFLIPGKKQQSEDITDLLDPTQSMEGDAAKLRSQPAAKLAAVCKKVQDAVTFDNAAGTVTMKLDHKWIPWNVTLAGTWASVVDKKWVAAQGDWDGNCKTWQNFYGIQDADKKLLSKTNGTGPYMLDHWTPSEEIVLTANPHYRKGPAKLQRIVFTQVAEFGTRLAALQAGDNDEIIVGSAAEYTQLDPLVRDDCDFTTGQCQPYKDAKGNANPNGILRRYVKRPRLARSDLFFTFKVADGSPFIGSGQLDGSGIPTDFFSDVNVRKAFAYCFDYDTYIKDVENGEGTPSLALTLPGQPGYDGSPHYSYDLQKCADAFKASTLKDKDGRSLWDVGFYLQVGYNVGGTARQAIAEIMAAAVQQVNPKFFISPVALPWPTFLHGRIAGQFAVYVTGWHEDIHDPHNWYAPYFLTAYSNNFPKELRDKYSPLISQGVFETDPAKRAPVYSQLNQMIYDDAALIILPIELDRYYEPLYVNGWFGSITRNPLIGDQAPYYYELSKN